MPAGTDSRFCATEETVTRPAGAAGLVDLASSVYRFRLPGLRAKPATHQVAPDRFLVCALLEGRSESGAAAAGAGVSALVHLHFVHFTGQPVRYLEDTLAGSA